MIAPYRSGFFDLIKFKTFHDILPDFFDVFRDRKSRICFQNNVKTIIRLRYSCFVVLRKSFSVIFHDFPWPTIKFHDFPGLENEIVKLHDFPWLCIAQLKRVLFWFPNFIQRHSITHYAHKFLAVSSRMCWSRASHVIRSRPINKAFEFTATRLLTL